MKPTLESVIAAFGAEAKAKLANVAAAGEPEDQFRTPLERLIEGMAGLCGLPPKVVAAVGESSLSDLKTRPDYAVTVRDALVGFIEIKAPGAKPPDLVGELRRYTLECDTSWILHVKVVFGRRRSHGR